MGTVDVKALHNVLVVEFFERIDFPLEHLLLGPVPDGPEVDDLDGHLFSSSLVDASEDSGAEALPDQIVQAVGVILYFFAYLIVARRESHSKGEVIFLRFININCSIFK